MQNQEYNESAYIINGIGRSSRTITLYLYYLSVYNDYRFNNSIRHLKVLYLFLLLYLFLYEFGVKITFSLELSE